MTDDAAVAPLRIVFVDDEPRLLQGLERMLRSMRSCWDMRFVESAAAAIATLEQTSADIIVSDMRMPGLTGGQLLTEVMRRWPSMVRIILSGHADRELIERTIGPTHQFLLKPCDAETLKTTIQRVNRLRSSLSHERLRSLVAGLGHLPSLPSLYLELIERLQHPDVTLEQIGSVVGRDMGMVTRVLQLVNSAFYASRRRVISPAEAVGILGIGTLRSLAISVHAFESMALPARSPLNAEALWQDSLRCSILARRIAHDAGLTNLQGEEAALAGSLRDIGRLLLAVRCPTGFVELSRQIRHPGDYLLERNLLGCTHGEVGASLLGIWGIADSVIEAVAWHHEPSRAGNTPSVTSCVHVASALLAAEDGHPDHEPIDEDHLAATDLTRLLPAWSDAAQRMREGVS